MREADHLSRGPAKGYIEGLEHRLHEAETLLLHLLPTVTPVQLDAATANLHHSYPNSNHDSPSDGISGSYSPPVLNKKTGVEYWESFPLDSVDNIRRWQHDCAQHNSYRDELTRTSRHGSRPNSADLSREVVLSPARKQNHVPHFRTSMSNEDFVPTTRAEYLNTQAQPHAQTFNGLPGSDGTYIPMGTGFQDASWEQQQQRQGQPPMSGMHLHQQAQPIQVAAGGDMDMAGGFFSGDVKRNLFW